MARSTHRSIHPPRLWLLVACAAILAAALAGPSAVARADGGPASDVLATQTLFLPQDAWVVLALGAALIALAWGASLRAKPLRAA